ncbi:MAG: ABC transporter ATP-binding protein [Firmicutes bacterium]|uniref:Putative ABC transport system ATP-binding protein n=1 Tax=Melghirimyces thermohalophilus TaxID=1236220 RepID=A0A1G6HLK0_9BACL|nr:ABC transporter ATP-binding protein [Melghirimyces thermohalophilus]MDA8352886.1 ABC transporter ATP-binding protein [Bacillota bacterium]SDB95130.1 putative ABC transport system ATP-binding protein [Melghirimyces thermohalophilus]
MITLKDLRKSYEVGERQVDVLNGLDLEIKQGDMLAIMGRSGSGKSTLLNILAGLDTADSGVYQYKQVYISEMNGNQRAQFRKKHIGFIVQNFALIDSKNVFENIALPLRYSKLSRGEIRDRVDRVLADLRITELQSKAVDTLSGGEMQRVAIARALIQNPDLILADEPTGALDEQTEAEILDIFAKLNQQGKTLVVVTHDQVVADYCQQIYYMQEGKVAPITS